MADQESAPSFDRTLQSAGEGDPEAWRCIVQTYSGRLYAALVRQCGDQELAEEITQATFVKVVTQIARYREQGRFEPWLFRIAMNQLRDEMRRRKRQARPMDMTGSGSREDGQTDGGWSVAQDHAVDRVGSGSDDPAERASIAEEVARLRAAIERLSAADQEVLTLRHTAGLSFGQIAEVLGEPLGTVLARGHRAMAKLRKLLDTGDTQAPSGSGKPGQDP